MKNDNVNHPEHYEKCSIECIDIMLIMFGAQRLFDYCAMNAYKYLHRYKYKNGIEDLNKAMWYSDKCYELMSGYEIYDTEHAEAIRTVLIGHMKEYTKESEEREQEDE